MREFLPIIIALVTVALAAPLAFKLFFSGAEEFWECVRYSIKPDFFSWLDKDLQRDYSKSLKLGVFGFVLIFIGLLTGAFVDGVLS